MLEWQEGDSVYFAGERLHIIDQTRLPAELEILELSTPEDVAEAIKRLAVRGAMAIGVAGAYGVLLGALGASGSDENAVGAAAEKALRLIESSRPTARNLFWACERMEAALRESSGLGVDALLERLEAAADSIAAETVETNRELVKVGEQVVGRGETVLTHCNSGPLAAVRFGTAVGVIIEAHRSGKGVKALVDETRPLLQGSRLTAWELGRAGVPYTLVTDSMAADLMRRGEVDAVITGADRIAANGDSANKIGTYGLAALARAHGIGFYIAAPGSTVDLECRSGDEMVIEERDPDEVRRCGGSLVAPSDARVHNPAFDVTPGDYIEGIITEKGLLKKPYRESLQVFLSDRTG